MPSSGLVSLGLAGVPEASCQIRDRQAGHTFTPSQLSFLVGRGWDCDCVQQKLMRHSDIRTTMNIYGDVVTDEMERAHSKVVALALNRGSAPN